MEGIYKSKDPQMNAIYKHIILNVMNSWREEQILACSLIRAPKLIVHLVRNTGKIILIIILIAN
jgi:hypothetical protein